MKFDINTKSMETEEIGASFKNRKAKISEKNSPYIFSLLSNIYSKPVPSIVREITSNCFDAHIESGTPDEPVLIRLFADETSQLHIEFIDNGLGIPPEKMDDIFMSYGESSKRDSDDFIGAFGLGSKSPFSYNPYFYVITKAQSVNEKGELVYMESTYLLNTTVTGPEYDCLTQKVLDEPSTGTIIRIPLKQPGDLEQWKTAMRTQLKYFTNVYFVNFDGLQNDHTILQYETFKMREDLFKANHHQPLHLALGDVTYPIQFDELGIEPINLNVALKFKIGELDVSPNREEIKYTPKSKAALINQLNQFKDEIMIIIRDERNYNFTDLFDYYDALFQLAENKIFPIHNFLENFVVNLNLNQFKLITVADVKLKLLLENGEGIQLNYKRLNPEKNTKFLFRKQYHDGSDRLTKVNPKGRYSNDFSFFNIDKEIKSKYVFVNKPTARFKLNERRWLVDNNYNKVLYFNKKEFRNILVDNIRQNNDLKKGLDNVKKAIDIFYELLPIFENRCIYRSENAQFENLVSLIPDKYGIEKKASIKKKEDTILYYSYNGDRFRRNEILPKDFTTRFDTITIVASHKDKDLLRRFYSRLSKLSVKVLYCSDKYIKMIQHHPNVFELHSINHKSSQFWQRPEIISILHTNLEKETYKTRHQSFQFMIHESTIKSNIDILSKEKEFKDTLCKVYKELTKKLFKKSVEDHDIQVLNFLTKYYDQKYLDNFKEKYEQKIAPLFTTVKIYQEFEKDFFMDFFAFRQLIDDCESSEMYLEMFKHSIALKQEIVNKYLKLV